jgi:hypothetical protein
VTRRELIALLGTTAAAAWPVAARVQQTKRLELLLELVQPLARHLGHPSRPPRRSPQRRTLLSNPFARDVLLDPGGTTMPRMTALHMLRSTITTVSAPASSFRGSITHPTQPLCTLRVESDRTDDVDRRIARVPTSYLIEVLRRDPLFGFSFASGHCQGGCRA